MSKIEAMRKCDDQFATTATPYMLSLDRYFDDSPGKILNMTTNLDDHAIIHKVLKQYD